MGLLTFLTENPKGYGKNSQKKNKVVAIVEEKDATKKEREISGVNSGIIAISAKDLKRLIPYLRIKNSTRKNTT